MMKSKKTKNVDVDKVIEIHINELIKPVIEPVLPTPDDPAKTRPVKPEDSSCAPTKRGRPHASESRNERTRDSYDASVFVHDEMNKYRGREKTKRVLCLLP
jgi:hypothetical protein